METTKDRAIRTYAIYAEKRDDLGLNDHIVSKKAEVTPSTLYDWKYGSYTPKFGKLVKIAAVINEKPEIFL